MTKSSDLERATHSYIPLSDQPESSNSSPGCSRNAKIISGVVVSLLLLSGLILLIVNQGTKNPLDKFNVGCVGSESVKPNTLLTPSRGVSQGVSEKTFRGYSGENGGYPWTNAMLAWQRTAFHFQPENNWMNDPNGPLFYMGWYHFFYQYNPESAVWGNISWGHAVSKDLIHWLHLPFAMVPDQWYDINGVWTGSATFLADGQLVMLYTGDTNEHVQVQNLAYPANLSDPLLIDWVKYKNNPVLVPPPGIGAKDFRDPTTAWLTKDGKWRIAIGSKVNKTGISLVYETTDFTSYELLDGAMHGVPGTGMWECVDFYPVSTTGLNGLDTSVDGPGVKHVLKESSDDDRNDYYAIGTYDPITGKWKPDNPDLDVGVGLRYDYGKFYAAKSFYDQNKQRRILWGWIQETDSEVSDLLKGWASLQAIPRTVVYDRKTGTNLVQWPVVEVEKLRKNSTKFTDVKLAPGSVVPLNIGMATQLDIVATFELDKDTLQGLRQVEDVRYDCCTRGVGARGALGPFGILVIADEALAEYTPVYFYIAKDSDGSAITFFCTDESKSSKASDVSKRVHGSAVPVLKGEKLSMRVLVDHSIIESFAQGGRTAITSRIYPTRAIYGAAKLFLFNNATQARVTAAVKVWEMDSANIQRFPFDKSL